jgi:thiosulfate reductase cytochrome b subunit
MVDRSPASGAAKSPERDTQNHSALVRLAHWGNALAMLIMIGSGWRIYDWDPIFPFSFPFEVTLGGDAMLSEAVHNEDGLAGALQWHFAGMWLLALCFLVYVGYGFGSGHFRRNFFPLDARAIVRDFGAALRFRLVHRLGHYNAVQKAAYIAVLAAIAAMILSGLAIWKPTQFRELAWLFGGFDNARIVHFLGMCAIALFIVVHLALTLLVPKTLVAMIFGRASSPAAPDPRNSPALNAGGKQ